MYSVDRIQSDVALLDCAVSTIVLHYLSPIVFNTVAVVDFGGGTLDVTIGEKVAISSASTDRLFSLREMASCGDSFLGGRDLDHS